MQVVSPLVASSYTKPAPLALRIGFWFCTAIAVAVVIRRIIVLASSPQPSSAPTAALDLAFANHAVLTLAHIIPALVFVLLAPVVMFRKGTRFAWVNTLLYPVGVVVGLTAYAMSAYSIGGWLERSAVLVFDSLFLFSLWQAYRYKRLRRRGSGAPVAASCRCCSAGHCDHAAGYGDLFRYQPFNPPPTAAVLRNGFLDWVLDQRYRG